MEKRRIETALLTPLALVTSGLAYVALNSVSVESGGDPVRLQEDRAPAVYLRESEQQHLDTSGQPYPPEPSLDSSAKSSLKRTHPTRRVYGRRGQIGGRFRGDIKGRLR